MEIYRNVCVCRGGDKCLKISKILVTFGHCHRKYHQGQEMIASFRLSEDERGRRPRSHTKKSGSSKTCQQKAACGELQFIRFLGFQLAAV